MRLRTRKTSSCDVDNDSKETTKENDGSDSESDDEMKELASKSFQIMKEKLGLSSKSGAEPVEEDLGDSVCFVIDKNPGTSKDKEGSLSEHSQQDKDKKTKTKKSKRKRRKKKKQSSNTDEDPMALSSSLQVGMDTSDIYVNVDTYKQPTQPKNIDRMLLGTSKDDQIMQKSVVTSGFEKQHTVAPYQESLNQIKKQRRKEKESSKGRGWFNMKAPEMTEEAKNDLTVLQMRRVLDPKRFYKGPDLKALPKFYQMARVVDSPLDFYSSRVPKKERKKTLVDELLADAEFRKFNKRKYAEIVEAKSHGRGAYKHMKRLKKKKR